MVPAVYNYDSIGYNPDLVSRRGSQYLDRDLRRQVQGQVGPQRRSADRLRPGDPGDELARLVEGAEPRQSRQEGDRRSDRSSSSRRRRAASSARSGAISASSSTCWRPAKWSSADAWQPAVMAVKAQGKPCNYAVPKEGYRAWSIGLSLITGTPNKDAVIAYADYWLSGPPGDHRLRAGLLLADDQHQERHAGREIRLLVRGQALGRRAGARHQGRRSARRRLARDPRRATSPTGTSGRTNTTT